jgi:hypothetical protein
VNLGELFHHLAQLAPAQPPATVPSPANAADTFSWSSLPTLIISIATAVGLARVLELLITRKSRSTGDQKIQVDAASVISGELRQWTAEANNRAKAAEERATVIEVRLQQRADDLMAKLRATEEALDRLQDKIMSCQAGPICPVRTGDTDPRLPVVPRTT